MLHMSLRTFSIDQKEIRALENSVKRKMNVIRAHTELREFTYQPPQMYYDKKTGEIKVKEKEKEKKRKLIKNMDDLQNEKSKLMKEVGLDENGMPLDENESVDKTAESLKKLMARVNNEYDLDPKNFHVFSRDFMRVDVGLIVQRPPIFMTFRQRDAEFLKYKNEIMNEYYANNR